MPFPYSAKLPQGPCRAAAELCLWDWAAPSSCSCSYLWDICSYLELFHSSQWRSCCSGPLQQRGGDISLAPGVKPEVAHPRRGCWLVPGLLSRGLGADAGVSPLGAGVGCEMPPCCIPHASPTATLQRLGKRRAAAEPPSSCGDGGSTACPGTGDLRGTSP